VRGYGGRVGGVGGGEDLYQAKSAVGFDVGTLRHRRSRSRRTRSVHARAALARADPETPPAPEGPLATWSPGAAGWSRARSWRRRRAGCRSPCRAVWRAERAVRANVALNMVARRRQLLPDCPLDECRRRWFSPAPRRPFDVRERHVPPIRMTLPSPSDETARALSADMHASWSIKVRRAWCILRAFAPHASAQVSGWWANQACQG
jgi:hypothetical protein